MYQINILCLEEQTGTVRFQENHCFYRAERIHMIPKANGIKHIHLWKLDS
jgi:hypothetical protein